MPEDIDQKRRLLTGWTGFATATATLLGGAGSIIGALAAAGVIGGGSGSSVAQQQDSGAISGTTESAQVETQISHPTRAETRLAALIPVAIRPGCRRAKLLTANSQANIFCDADLDTYVSYSLFPTAAEADSYLRTRAVGDPTKKCGSSPTGASSYRDAQDRHVGRLKCYFARGEAWIEWTNNDFDVYAYAYRSDKNWRALFNFWQGAGPEMK